MSQKNNNNVVVRFAPSPTGFMHVGNLRTALYAWLWAKKNNGIFILRIEDTDKEREVAGAKEHILKVLKWIGINWDEGPDIGGPHSPYTQSERLDIYKKYAQILIEKGLAYADPYTEEEVENLRKKAEEEKKAFLYREHRPEKFDKWDSTKPLRFKVPVIKNYKWNDLVYGDLSAGPEALDDFILIKSDGYPTYNFCHIVDDIEMGITHVIRGQEYISSIPKYLSLYEALDVKPPIFACLPHILGSDGNKKLGKRDGAKDCLEYKDEGYLPEAFLNFLVLLGWHPSDDKEIFTVEELANIFSLDRVQKAGARWNDEKLNWFNKKYIQMLSDKKFSEFVDEFMPAEIKNLTNYNEKVERIIPIIKERIEKFEDIKDMHERGELKYFFERPEYNSKSLMWKDEKDIQNTKKYLEEILNILNKIQDNDFNSVSIKDAVWNFATENGKGNVLWPMRYALSGIDKSPDPFILASLLGKKDTLSRIETAIKKI
ncbi:MAG: Glutamate--tRNA ligase [Parcubacteria group bacterium Athens0714_16]|nr:MAG: Glutamate--tRNA ligase [Parcubacteria group bacterium Athens0714_16]